MVHWLSDPRLRTDLLRLTVRFLRAAPLGCVFALACNAVLGIEDRPLREEGDAAGSDAGGPSPGDGGGDGGPSSRYREEVLRDTPVVYLRLGEKSAGPDLVAKDEMGHLSGKY